MKTKRGRDADAYYRPHHKIDTVIGHSLGGAIALSLDRNNITKKVIIHMEKCKVRRSVLQLYQITYQIRY